MFGYTWLAVIGEFFLLPPAAACLEEEEDADAGGRGGRLEEADREDGDWRFRKDFRLFSWG